MLLHSVAVEVSVGVLTHNHSCFDRATCLLPGKLSQSRSALKFLCWLTCRKDINSIAHVPSESLKYQAVVFSCGLLTHFFKLWNSIWVWKYSWGRECPFWAAKVWTAGIRSNNSDPRRDLSLQRFNLWNANSPDWEVEVEDAQFKLQT